MVLFLIFFVVYLVHWVFSEGFAVNPETGAVYMEPYKYLHNLIDMPYLLIIMVIGIIGVVYAMFRTIFSKTWRKGIWFSGFGTVFPVLPILLCAGWNNTAFFPSLENLQSSLTIQNSSSSEFTLKVMAYVTILVTIVLIYLFFAWRALDRHIISEEVVENENNQAY